MSIHSFCKLRRMMDKKEEARKVVEKELNRYRKLPYQELLKNLNNSEGCEVKTENGEIYQIEVEVFYDDFKKKSIRVMGSASYNAWTDFSPICSDFIMATDGSFIGE